MKKLITIFAISAAIGAITARADDPTPVPTSPRPVYLQPGRVFAPPGFDDNDNVQLVVTGALPNTCFRFGDVEATVDHQAKKIVVKTRSYYYPGCWCLEVLVPYEHTVNLGILQAGEYQIIAEGAAGRVAAAGTLPVAVASRPGPDDQLYALVKSARVEMPQDAAAKPTLILTGVLTSSCMQQPRIQQLSRRENIVEVLPVVDLKPDAPCLPAVTQFETRVPLDTPWKGETLIHVRSLNGQSVNEIVDL